MPIYEYECRNCHNEFEKLVRSSGPVPTCPDCSSADLEKKLSTFAAVMGGSSASPSMSDLPAACGSCGNPGGPGACGMHRH